MNSKRVLSIKAAAEYSGYSRGTVTFWIDKGLLPYEAPATTGEKYRIIRIRRADLDKLLESFCRRNEPEETSRQGKPEGLILLPRESKLPPRERRAEGIA